MACRTQQRDCMHACRAPSVCRRRPWRVRRRVGPRHKDGEPLAWRKHTGGQQTAAFRGRSRLALTARARPGLGRGALGGHRRTGAFVARHALRRGVCRWRAPRLGARRLPDGRQPRPNMEVRHTRGCGHGCADGRRRVLGSVRSSWETEGSPHTPCSSAKTGACL